MVNSPVPVWLATPIVPAPALVLIVNSTPAASACTSIVPAAASNADTDILGKAAIFNVNHLQHLLVCVPLLLYMSRLFHLSLL